MINEFALNKLLMAMIQSGEKEARRTDPCDVPLSPHGNAIYATGYSHGFSDAAREILKSIRNNPNALERAG